MTTKEKLLTLALQSAMKALSTYGKHPIIEAQAKIAFECDTEKDLLVDIKTKEVLLLEIQSANIIPDLVILDRYIINNKKKYPLNGLKELKTNLENRFKLLRTEVQHPFSPDLINSECLKPNYE